MVDFNKLRDADGQKLREEIAQKHKAKEDSQKRMANYLKEQVDDGAIDNTWEQEFILSVYNKLQSCLPYLTEKQDEKLTQLFEKY